MTVRSPAFIRLRKTALCPVQRRYFAHFHIQSTPSIKLSTALERNLTTMAKMNTPIPELKLNDGTSIPMIAYGTGTALSKRRGGEADVDREIVESVKIAIKTGYRHFDCAESKIVAFIMEQANNL
jgi:ABC-type tungstate transport system permease subunit